MKATIAWILWLAGAMVFILSTRNPVYLILVLISLLAVGHRLAQHKTLSSWVLPNLRFLLTMVLISTLINALFSHVGSSVLFTIPKRWLLIGGNITLESMTYGAINGLVIGALYLLFNIINLAMPIKQLTRLIPRAFHPVAMMVTISLTFFPSIQQRAREIKEAQMIRGNPMKKISDWLPILIPLLVTSLENAILLAESMTARGFHKGTDTRTPVTLVALILGAFSVFAGWILSLYHYSGLLNGALYVVGISLIIVTFVTIGRRSKITRYHQESWGRTDVVAVSMLSLYLASFAFFALSERLPSLGYSPYPQLSFPALQIAGLVFSLISLVPGLVLRHD